MDLLALTVIGLALFLVVLAFLHERRKEERQSWMVWVEAEARLHYDSNTLVSYEVCCQARKTLVDRFGVNVDDMQGSAAIEWKRLLEDVKTKRELEDA